MRKLLLLAVLLFCAASAHAQGTFTAASCNFADVNGLINNTGGSQQHQAVNGDKIIIPAGTCTWTSGVVVHGVGITVTGSGTPNSGAGTTGAGTSTTTLINNANAPYFQFTNLAFGQTAKLELLNLNASNPSTDFNVNDTADFVGTCTASGCAQFRLDNITWGTNNWKCNIGDGGFVATDNVFGVVDHNTGDESGISCAGGEQSPPLVQIGFSAWAGTGAWGDNSFSSADTFGTAQSIFIENNKLTAIRGTENDVGAPTGSLGGLRAVCRFNTIFHMSGTGLCSAHGTPVAGRTRGQRQLEVYYNTVNVDSGGCDAVNGLNSGTGYYLSNTILGPGCNKFVNLDIFRYTFMFVYGSCDGTEPWDQSPWSTTTICLDQPGRSQYVLFSTANPPTLASSPGTPCSTAGQCYTTSTLDPVYEAGETISPGGFPNPAVTTSGDGTQLRVLANRDYYSEVSQTAQTSATSPFNGTSGTGYGTLARRPTTCTPRVGYWATDQGTWNNGGAGGILYACLTTNTWTAIYTPYTYPHPLTNSTPVTPPPAPATTMFAAIKSGTEIPKGTVLP